MLHTHNISIRADSCLFATGYVFARVGNLIGAGTGAVVGAIVGLPAPGLGTTILGTTLGSVGLVSGGLIGLRVAENFCRDDDGDGFTTVSVAKAGESFSEVYKDLCKVFHDTVFAPIFCPDVNVPPSDPIVIDLDGDGIELLSRAQGVYFDMDADGFAERTGWVSPDDGLLVRDIDGNGAIETLAEIFGDATDLTRDGFAVLAELDFDGNGVIDARDRAFSSLRIWVDANSDGITDSGELQTLSSHAIASISLTSQPGGEPIAENEILRVGNYTKTNGAIGEAAAVGFSISQIDSRYLAEQEIAIPQKALLLPRIQGFVRGKRARRAKQACVYGRRIGERLLAKVA